MSYILDALRRADAERAAAPGLHAQAPVAAIDDDDEDLAAKPQAQRAPKRLLGAAAVLALVGLLVWWWMPAGEDAATEQASSGRVAPDAGRPAAAGGRGLPPIEGAPPAPPPGLPALPREPARPPEAARVAEPLPQTRGEGRPPAAAEPAAAAKAPASSSTGEQRVWSLAELPDEIRRQLPSLNVGGSVYSADASARMIILNGQVFHERDDLGNGTVVEQIRPHQAILSFQGYRYKISY